MAFDRSKMKEGLKQRQQEQESIRNDGNSFETYLNISEGVNQWSPKFKEKPLGYMFDIVPFIVGSKWPTYPNVKRQGVSIISLKEGDPAYVLNLFIHTNVGPQNLRIVCPYENFGLPCPICEEKLEKLAQTYVKEERHKIHQEFGTQHRVVYNVVVRDKGEEQEKGVQILDYPFHWMEEKLQSLKINKSTGEERFYSWPDKDGYSIYFEGTKPGERKYILGGYELVARTYDLSDKELSGAITLDELVVLKNYDQIKELTKVKKVKREDTPQEELPPRKGLKQNTPSVPKEEEPIGDDVPLDFPQTASSEDAECPWGGILGVEFDEYEECGEAKCKVFQLCKAENAKLRRPTPKRKLKNSDDIPF